MITHGTVSLYELWTITLAFKINRVAKLNRLKGFFPGWGWGWGVHHGLLNDTARHVAASWKRWKKYIKRNISFVIDINLWKIVLNVYYNGKYSTARAKLHNERTRTRKRIFVRSFISHKRAYNISTRAYTFGSKFVRSIIINKRAYTYASLCASNISVYKCLSTRRAYIVKCL